MSSVEWGQAVRPSVKDLISTVNELESYTDIEHEVTGTFLERETANGLGGLSGVAEVQEILGNTVVWNQLANDATMGVLNCTAQKDSDGVIEITATATSSNYYSIWIGDNIANNVATGHKVLVACEMKGEFTTTTPVGITNSNAAAKVNYTNQGEWQLVGAICTITAGTSHLAQFYARPSQGVSWATGSKSYVRKRRIVDLTTFYGAGNEPASIADFYAEYGDDDYAYSTPTLLSSNIAGIEGAGSCEFPAQTLRGIGTAQDVMTKRGIERKIGVVDLGDLSWTYNTGNGTMRTEISGMKPYQNTSDYPLTKNAKYSYGGPLGVNATPPSDKAYYIRSSTGTSQIMVYDSEYTDAVTFKAAMSGVMFQYELATPTTETFAEPLDLTYTVEENGTESWITPTGTSPTSSAPTATISYKMQYEYELITEKSFDNFCTALGTALNLDIEKEWNDVTKEWEFTIASARSNLNAIDISEREELYSIDDERDILESNILEPIEEVDENEQR